MTGPGVDDLGATAARVAGGLRAAAVAIARLPRSAQPSLGRRLAGVADLAKRDVVAAERSLARLRRRVDAVADRLRPDGVAPEEGVEGAPEA